MKLQIPVNAPAKPNDYTAYPDASGRFGDYGGRYVPETLMPLVHELDAAYTAAKNDPAFQAELRSFRPGLAYLSLYLGFEGDIQAAGASAANVWIYESLDIGSVFYMSALLYPDDHKPGEPNALESWLAELERA